MCTNRFGLLLACAAVTGAGFATSTASAQGHDANLAIAVPLVPFAQVGQPAQRPSMAASDGGIGGIGAAIDVDRLARLRGGESTVENDVLIDGTVDGNTADHVVSGSNSISEGAFANAAGINTVIQNTGSNVLIQNGMVVNIQFVAPVP